MLVPILALTALLIQTPTTSEPQAGSASAAPSQTIAPVPLPDAALADSDYKTALAALIADPTQRAGVYISLVQYLPSSRKSAMPSHVPVIVELLIQQLDSANQLETIQPLRLLARCGALAQAALPKAVKLSESRIVQVRAAAVEALGGMFFVASKPATLPDTVATLLIQHLQTDRAPFVRMNSAVAIGRAHLATPEAITALTAAANGSDPGIVLGALDAAENLASDAHAMLPAITNLIGNQHRVNNAVPTLLAVATPQETVDAMAQTLTTTNDFTVRQTLVYYAGQVVIKKEGPNVQALAAAVKPLLMPLPPAPPAPVVPVTPASATPPAEVTTQTETSPTSPTKPPAPKVVTMTDEPIPPPTADDLAKLRIAAARTYVHLGGDTKSAAVPLTELTTDINTPPAIRRDAVSTIQLLGGVGSKNPAVVQALVTALTDSDAGVQSAAVNVLFKLGGPATAAAAPRLSELLLTAWQNKDNARVYSLINALYRIGPVAAPTASPVLKKIIAGEPKGSSNARFAQIALDRLSAK